MGQQTHDLAANIRTLSENLLKFRRLGDMKGLITNLEAYEKVCSRYTDRKS